MNCPFVRFGCTLEMDDGFVWLCLHAWDTGQCWVFVFSLVGIQCPYVFVQCLYREKFFKTVNTIQFKYDGTTLILVYEGEGMLLVLFPNIINIIVHILIQGGRPGKTNHSEISRD